MTISVGNSISAKVEFLGNQRFHVSYFIPGSYWVKDIQIITYSHYCVGLKEF